MFLLTFEVDWGRILEASLPQVGPPQCSLRDPAQMHGADQTASAARANKTHKSQLHTSQKNIFHANSNKVIQEFHLLQISEGLMAAFTVRQVLFARPPRCRVTAEWRLRFVLNVASNLFLLPNKRQTPIMIIFDCNLFPVDCVPSMQHRK